MALDLHERINAFAALGDYIDQMPLEEFQTISDKAIFYNPWFIPENLTLAIKGILKYLDKNNLQQWVGNYSIPETPGKNIGIIMAGNIPMVGFHDLLSVLTSGNSIQAKLSAKDPTLVPYLTGLLCEIEPRFEPQISYIDPLEAVKLDAVIATGSDNSARYFHYNFYAKPHVIRQNRTSIGIINGTETEKEIKQLGNDIFHYFGLGCRNISKIYIPNGYDITSLSMGLKDFQDVINHSSYHHNYLHARSIYRINRQKYIDSGYLILKEDPQLVSPIGVLYYETYDSINDLQLKLESFRDKIQCVVSQKGWFNQSIYFGKTQVPELWDYADHVDTMKFLINLN